MLILVFVSILVLAGIVGILAWNITRHRSGGRLPVGTARDGANVAMHVVRLR